MINSVKKLFVCVVAIVLLSGCVATTTTPEKKSEELSVQTRDAEMRMVAAIESRDYFKVNSLLSPSLAKIINPTSFVAFCNELDKCGEYQGATFVTELTLPVFKTGVWKFRYQRELEDGSKVIHERLLLITMGKLDGRDMITGLAVQ